ncbi:hypothetical protein HC248_00619 [Polaromonas vacuolata]|uniref:DUF1468 domain-containing protein n=1 Tax=Polaromonas vacuolata TaxID=37448 RepID=A0A6H2H641_9BURK|nr:tripartite tricarboxylate transporter TctB family protein [Polaromonas vacuolata]QJC55341.1 hypothetical protein HC248_00619 [Polaromonas vacuolata]
MKIKSQKDFFSGLLFMGIGVAFALGATSYNVGIAARMGPGYFPLILGILMAVLGAGVLFKSLTIETPSGDKIGRWAWRPLVYIILANLVFGVMLGGLPSLNIPAMGMILGIYALTFIASVAEPGWKVKNTFILATILAVGSYIAFVVLLKLQFAVWPTFITG